MTITIKNEYFSNSGEFEEITAADGLTRINKNRNTISKSKTVSIKTYKGGERMNVPKKETKLKKILRDRGIKQQFVADKMGVNVRKINDYVNGRTSLKLDVAIKIADILNIDVKELA